MIVAYYDHQTKGARIAAALTDAGHTLTRIGDPDADVAVTDLDADTVGVDWDAHPRIVVYPHGGNPLFDWDVRPPHPNVRLHLVHAAGHAALSHTLAPHIPAAAVGWCYSDVAPPRYPAEPGRVVFAPSHALTNGRIDPAVVEANRHAATILARSGFEVTVRRFEDGLHLAHADLDDADLVVAEGTIAHLAAARGAPVLWVGADLELDMAVAGPPKRPPSWAEWLPRFRYPYDVADGPFDELAAATCRPDPHIDEWRACWVGGQFDPHLAVRLIEEAACG